MLIAFQCSERFGHGRGWITQANIVHFILPTAIEAARS